MSMSSKIDRRIPLISKSVFKIVKEQEGVIPVSTLADKYSKIFHKILPSSPNGIKSYNFLRCHGHISHYEGITKEKFSWPFLNFTGNAPGIFLAS